MIKKSVYPKTKRIGLNSEVIITEKIDGSNLCLFKLNGNLYIAQRNNIFELNEIDECVKQLYQGLYGWLKENGQHLQNELNETSAICGEWIGMGKLKYNFNERFLMFAKANVNEDYQLFNINYTRDYFIYPFIEKEIPSYIGLVPLVFKGQNLSYENVLGLNQLYDEYAQQVNRNVEGFVINRDNNILKYVRMKNGQLSEHKVGNDNE